MPRFMLLVLLVLAASGAEARMYQWVDPVTGTVQMSGTPPAWYRAERDGPRVRVFESGRIVDDTSIAVSEQESAALREAAFRQVEEQRELEALKELEAEALKEAAREERLRETAELRAEDFEEPEPQAPETITEQDIEQLKDLIRQWDQLNTP